MAVHFFERVSRSFRRLIAAAGLLALAMLIAGCDPSTINDITNLFGTNAHSGCPHINYNPNATGLTKVRHIVVLMQENRSFDHYFGALPYASGSPYHAGVCASTDNQCVDALTCGVDSSSNITCTNSN